MVSPSRTPMTLPDSWVPAAATFSDISRASAINIHLMLVVGVLRVWVPLFIWPLEPLKKPLSGLWTTGHQLLCRIGPKECPAMIRSGL